MHFLAVARQAGGGVVDAQRAVLVDRLLGASRKRALAVEATQRHAHARKQLLYGERLHQIIVGTGIEGRHFVGILEARGQHDHRQRRPLPQRADNAHAVAVRQSQIEDGQVGRLRRQLQQRLGSRLRLVHRVPMHVERRCDQTTHSRVVLDHEYPVSVSHALPPSSLHPADAPRSSARSHQLPAA